VSPAADVPVTSVNAASVTAAADGGAGISVEPRQGTTATAIMTFNAAVTSASGATITVCRRWTGTAAAACVTNPTVGAVTTSGNQVLIPLSGITDQSRVQITLATVNGGTVNAQMTIGFLAGDINGNGFVEGTDVSNVKARVAASQAVTVSATAFRADINANGSFEGTDSSSVSSRVGRQLP
jgi:Dockerin type I domain